MLKKAKVSSLRVHFFTFGASLTSNFQKIYSIEFTFILIVESGKLVRTKLSCDESEKAAVLAAGINSIKEHSVVVDEIVGSASKAGGHITGSLHAFEAGAKAYATVIASEPTKVWKVPKQNLIL